MGLIRERGTVGLGLLGITKEAARLLRKYGALLLPVKILFHIPLLLVIALQEKEMTPEALGEELARKGITWKFLKSMPPIFIKYVLFYLTLAAIALRVSGIYDWEATSIPSGKNWLRSLPRAFGRVFVTGIWLSLISAILTGVLAPPMLLLVMIPRIGALKSWFIQSGGPPKGLATGGVVVVDCLMSMYFISAGEISVLDGPYGIAALVQSASMTKGKRLKALVLASAVTGTNYLLGLAEEKAQTLMAMTLSQPRLLQESWRNPTTLLFVVFVHPMWGLFQTLMFVVFYFLCKRNEEEQRRGDGVGTLHHIDSSTMLKYS